MRARYSWQRRTDVYLPDFMAAWRSVIVASSSSNGAVRGALKDSAECGVAATAGLALTATAAAPRAVDSRNSQRETGCEVMAGSRGGTGEGATKRPGRRGKRRGGNISA